MQSFANRNQRVFPLTVLLLVLLLALPMSAGAQAALDDSVFMSIRHYDGVDPMDMTEIERITRESFVPILSESDGFLGYYVVYSAEDTLAAFNLFETREQSLAANELAREFVGDSLALLLPNPPRVVEGSVDIGFVEMLAGMGDGGVGSLHASVRIYDGFETDDLEAFVALVEDGFLPIMRETDGFFGYYLMHDDAGALAAVSIFDTEASALASNEKARVFVAENLSVYLPEDPLISSGRVGIALLAGVNEGAHLVDDMTAGSVFASVRVYAGVDPADQDEIARRTDAGFLPIMRESQGFVGYFLLPAGERLAAISLFDSAEQASASAEKAREFVAENLTPLLPNAPTVYEGRLSIDLVNAPSAADAVPRDGALYASIRFYEGFDLQHFDEANDLAIAHLVPALQELGGLFAQFALNDGENTVIGISVFDNEEAALASNDVGKAFTMEYFSEWAPNPPSGVSGKLAVAALAEVSMGENLVGAMME